MTDESEGEVVPHVLIVEARYYEDIADELLKGATTVLDAAGIAYDKVSVPGAFEIPAAIRYAIKSREFNPVRRRFDGYIALGCVIRGETAHFDYICQECARGIQELINAYTLAVGFGVLTVDDRKQAMERASVKKRNKGGEAAEACLKMIGLKRQFRLFPRA
ncbi:MAG TPA: 6,7-dimethyl-8-ribityllumazine synthase [Alphaproteobacteria bacterium]|jgi:6,7-dimethyl-8-ribityllumazine synthase